MAINAYINFNGNCREAVEFYSEVFGTEKPVITTYGDTTPDPEYPLSEEAKKLIMHTRLNITGSTVMFSDAYPGYPYVAGNNISLAIVTGNIEELKSIFNKLKEGGTIAMDLQETFWSKCYGSLTDKFGIEWQVSYDNGEMGM